MQLMDAILRSRCQADGKTGVVGTIFELVLNVELSGVQQPKAREVLARCWKTIKSGTKHYRRRFYDPRHEVYLLNIPPGSGCQLPCMTNFWFLPPSQSSLHA